MTRGHVAGRVAEASLRDLAAVLRNARDLAAALTLPGRPAPDRRTPMEVARDNWLEDIAEARAERRRESTDEEADLAADRYYEGPR